MVQTKLNLQPIRKAVVDVDSDSDVAMSDNAGESSSRPRRLIKKKSIIIDSDDDDNDEGNDEDDEIADVTKGTKMLMVAVEGEERLAASSRLLSFP
jgi:hypothetical protein